MERQDLEDRETLHPGDWGGDDSEDTSPRFAVGTCEVPRLVIDQRSHDLPYEDVARIVHDLKGPLGTISLEVELLGENVASGETVETKPIVDRIMRNIEFLDRMVMDLLDQCTLDAGRFQLRRVPTELRALLEHVIERAVPTRDRERVFLHARDPVILDLDQLRIERVVANLLHNALKYSPPGTGIIVKLDREHDLTRVSVTDAGHGLTRVELANIFDEYHRGARESHEGTGLGLFLSKQIIEAHGATIGVDSIPGEGTRFYFELPTTS